MHKEAIHIINTYIHTYSQVSTLERRLKRDAVYKAALRQRTEIAEKAAEKRWSEAENKIPALETKITEANNKSVHMHMFVCVFITSTNLSSHTHEKLYEKLWIAPEDSSLRLHFGQRT